jgi:predicted aldo/keto reductase-like oxidoreductase
MHRLDRRRFIKSSLAGAGLVVTAPALFSAESVAATGAARSAVDRVLLGKTGLKVSFLAQGTGFNGSARQSDHTRMGQPAFDRLLRHSLDEGVNFIDMADLYGTHPFVRQTIKDLPRDKFVLLSKVWPRKEDWNTPSANGKEEIDRFRKELGVDVIDICLVHCATNDKWAAEYEGIRDGLSELKQKGAVRAVGCSCHDHGALKVAATHPWVDVIFARINNRGGNDYSMDGTAEEIAATLKLARANGKAVVGMKIFGAGKLVTPEEKDASLKYVLGNKLVDAMTIGMKKTEEVDDSITRITKTLKA